MVLACRDGDAVGRAPLCLTRTLRGRSPVQVPPALAIPRDSTARCGQWPRSRAPRCRGPRSPAGARGCPCDPAGRSRRRRTCRPDAGEVPRLGRSLTRRGQHLGGLSVELPGRPQRQAPLVVLGEAAASFEARPEAGREDDAPLRIETVVEPPNEPRQLRPSDSVRGPLPFEPLRATVCPSPPPVNNLLAFNPSSVGTPTRSDARRDHGAPEAGRRRQRSCRTDPSRRKRAGSGAWGRSGERGVVDAYRDVRRGERHEGAQHRVHVKRRCHLCDRRGATEA